MKQLLLAVWMSFAFSLLVGSIPAAAQWKTVKKFVQPGVETIEETKSYLILHHPEVDALVVLTLKDASAEEIERAVDAHSPGTEVLRLDAGTEADIQGKMDQQRGGNPYRVWVATERFWNDPARPRSIWGRFFRVEFLKILRAPGSQS